MKTQKPYFRTNRDTEISQIQSLSETTKRVYNKC